MSRFLNGLAAGAVGTAMLNAATYVDMVLRGRPFSPIPEQDVERMTERAGVSLGQDDWADARRSGLGALMGFVTGAAGGAAYGLLRPAGRWVPQPVAVVVVGLGVMAAADVGSVALGTTDPRSWSPADWAADMIPHLFYGAGVVVTYDALER